jgi:hypothetical protein
MRLLWHFKEGMNAMATTKELLWLNTLNDKTALERLQRAALKTKWLSRFSDKESLTMDVIEECYHRVADKYPIVIGYIMRASQHSWSATVKDSNSHAWIVTCKGNTLYETMLKVIIAMYAHLIRGEYLL